MNYTNSEIIKLIEEGDLKAYKSLFSEYFNSLVQFASGYVFDKEVTKDLVQDVFIYLWENHSQLKIKNLKSYLYTAVKNKCLHYINHLNVRDKHKVFIVNNYLELHDDAIDYDPELIKQIKAVLEALPKEMKRVFKAKYFYDLTVPEIAEDLSISPNTVKTHLKRAKAALRDKLFI
ncbi:RNA polymerase sigma-70 factor [Carboxylicivirga sp. N1Y90]|uniref:RNA polymerase sigma-70 factor n=1 Tax=Carboxylicivirga fragile TaxID=3417571 RepID=UPI003D338A31|nr:RNA polymerase sigma-70 factor [Marinilabiliaceae bacterium N1Y90]